MKVTLLFHNNNKLSDKKQILLTKIEKGIVNSENVTNFLLKNWQFLWRRDGVG